MPVQKILLWVMLASLAVAAALGAYSALTAHPDTVYRIIGSLILAAVCSGLLLVTTRQRRSSASPAAGIAASIVIVAEFILGMSLVWDLLAEEQTAELVGALAVIGPAAVVSILLLGLRSARIAGAAGLALDAATLILWLEAIYNRSGALSAHWFQDGCAVACMSVLAVCGLVGVGTDRWHWRWIGIAAAGAGCYALIHASDFDLTFEPVPLVIAIAAVVGHANLVLRAPLRGSQRWLIFATIAAAVLTAATGNAADFTASRGVGISSAGDLLGRIAAASAILAGCGTLAVAILARITSKSEAAASPILKVSTVALDCPICGKRQSVGKTPAACDGCGLLMSIQLQEPRCAACGYSLLMLKADHCPECGAAVGSVAPTAANALAT